MNIRSPDIYRAQLDSLDVENEPMYQPGYLVPNSTWCNRVVSDATERLRCPVPLMLANEQHAWLSDERGKAAGWIRLVDFGAAVAAADIGQPTIASWANPAGQHGHIALVRPGGHITQAGAHNHNDAPLARGFGDLQPDWFTHS